MDGMLSQDEINALLQGMDLSDTADSGASPETPQDSSSAENTDNGYVKDVAPTVGDEEKLTDVEKDAIGVNTSLLKEIPEGYKLDTVGDITINYGIATVYVSRK